VSFPKPTLISNLARSEFYDSLQEVAFDGDILNWKQLRSTTADVLRRAA
jgi:hypothetical protein